MEYNSTSQPHGPQPQPQWRTTTTMENYNADYTDIDGVSEWIRPMVNMQTDFTGARTLMCSRDPRFNSSNPSSNNPIHGNVSPYSSCDYLSSNSYTFTSYTPDILIPHDITSNNTSFDNTSPNNSSFNRFSSQNCSANPSISTQSISRLGDSNISFSNSSPKEPCCNDISTSCFSLTSPIYNDQSIYNLNTLEVIRNNQWHSSDIFSLKNITPNLKTSHSNLKRDNFNSHNVSFSCKNSNYSKTLETLISEAVPCLKSEGDDSFYSSFHKSVKTDEDFILLKDELEEFLSTVTCPGDEGMFELNQYPQIDHNLKITEVVSQTPQNINEDEKVTKLEPKPIEIVNSNCYDGIQMNQQVAWTNVHSTKDDIDISTFGPSYYNPTTVPYPTAVDNNLTDSMNIVDFILQIVNEQPKKKRGRPKKELPVKPYYLKEESTAGYKNLQRKSKLNCEKKIRQTFFEDSSSSDQNYFPGSNIVSSHTTKTDDHKFMADRCDIESSSVDEDVRKKKMKKNNEASKRSRIKRNQLEKAMEKERDNLESKNRRLKAVADKLKIAVDKYFECLKKRA